MAGEGEAETQSQMSQEDEEEQRQIDKDVRRMFYLQPNQSLQDVTWQQIIDKFRDQLNRCKQDLGNVSMREVQDKDNPMAPLTDMEIDEEVQKMLGDVEYYVNYALQHKLSLGPLVDMQTLLQRIQRLLQIRNQQDDIWKRIWHITVLKSEENIEPKGPAPEEEMQMQLDEMQKTIQKAVKESTESMQRTADDYSHKAEATIAKLETRLKYLEADFTKHRQCKISYCHKGKGNKYPVQEEQEEEEPPKKVKAKVRG